jgi:hypothetical protein
VNLGATEGQAVFAPHVTSVFLVIRFPQPSKLTATITEICIAVLITQVSNNGKSSTLRITFIINGPFLSLLEIGSVEIITSNMFWSPP